MIDKTKAFHVERRALSMNTRNYVHAALDRYDGDSGDPTDQCSTTGRSWGRKAWEAMIMGRRCARLYASATIGELSDRITLPMDMKKLEIRQWLRFHPLPLRNRLVISPKRSARTQHVLTQCSHDTVGSGAVSEDVGCACDTVSPRATHRGRGRCRGRGRAPRNCVYRI